MVYETVGVAIGAVYVLGAVSCVATILFAVYYTEYVHMKRYLKYTNQLEKYAIFNEKIKVE